MKSDVMIGQERTEKSVTLQYCFSVMEFLNNKFQKLFLKQEWLFLLKSIVNACS